MPSIVIAARQTLRRKVSDEFTIPVFHHLARHRFKPRKLHRSAGTAEKTKKLKVFEHGKREQRD
ncbi:hypothetical protein [Bradyrhizobium sp. CCBAU 45384]|uniref:hypothetical protein n=1 Tax=Bradyrhizobium sp. CCBAU 45384 TaxID=858428 RepID=UPI002305550D|nr:hypothetical protein [Bradyrhizobium sp. CCBAU 45384]MDA9408569.1 hypothetical protein [Bradyrhizobium sp. CCBAU 45384]